MTFNQPTTTPKRERPTNESNGTHHFPRNPPPPTTQTTLHNSAIRFHYDPQHQPLWNDSLLGKRMPCDSNASLLACVSLLQEEI